MLLEKRVRDEGGRIPVAYGVTYVDYKRRETVCHPVPLNWIVRGALKAWQWVAYPKLELGPHDLQEINIRLNAENGSLRRENARLRQVEEEAKEAKELLARVGIELLKEFDLGVDNADASVDNAS